VGTTNLKLPGVGSWIAVAIDRKDIAAVGMAVITMALVILAYDQLLFRPIVAWADKFRFEQTAAQQRPRSWVLDIVRRTRLMRRLLTPISRAVSGLARLRLPAFGDGRARAVPGWLGKASDIVWILLV